MKAYSKENEAMLSYICRPLKHPYEKPQNVTFKIHTLEG